MKIIINNIIAYIKVGYLPTEESTEELTQRNTDKTDERDQKKHKKYGGKKVEVLISANL